MRSTAVTQKANYRESDSNQHLIAHSLRFKAMAAPLFVSFGLSLVMLIVITISSLTENSVPGRLVELTNLLLDQPVAQLSAYPCQLIFEQPERSERVYQCPSTFFYDSIQLKTVVSDADLIDTLIVRVNGVRIGDLILSWGYPDMLEVQGSSYWARWHSGFNIALDINRRPSYTSLVEAVVIRRRNQEEA